MLVRLSHVKRTTVHKGGRTYVYYYHRGTGKRIKGQPGTPEFVASYAEAAKPEQTDIGTFSALITGYVTSPEFGKLAEKMAAKEARRAQFKKAS